MESLDSDPMNGISALTKVSRGIPDPFYHVRTQKKSHWVCMKKVALTRHQICQYLDLALFSF